VAVSVLLRDFATARPDDIAIVDDHGSVTWAELDERVNRLIDALRARGLVEGDAIALMAGNQRAQFEVSLAGMQAGWLVVPVNWHLVADELAYIVDDADAKALVVDEKFIVVGVEAEARSAGLVTSIAISATPPERFESYESVLASGSADDPADQVKGGPMFYTSGTTGFPKGVRGGLATVGGPVEIWQLMAASLGEMMEVPAASPVQLVCGPAYHSAQWVYGMFPLLLGATVVFQHRFDAAEVLDLIDAHQVTNTHLVPAQMVRLLRLPDERRAGFDGASLVAVHHGAAPCPAEVKRAMIEWWGPLLTEYYGGTEGGFIANISATEWLDRPGSVGKALPVMEVLVRREDGEPAGTGEVGQIWFRSLLGMDFEYHNAPDKTAAAHREPGVGTLGDVGYLDDEGYLFLSDRKIDMIISGGVNIYPAEIEGVLAGHDAVADAAVIGIPDDEMGERVLAVLELTDGRQATPELEGELEAHCRAHLAGYKCPRPWDFVAALPRNAAGKLAKRTLREPYWADTTRRI
jgi:long-chain acyl-CoA synthetase